MATYSVRVTDGPGKFDLMLSLFEGKTVEFRDSGGVRMTVKVNGLAIEEGSRNDWLIDGYFEGTLIRLHAFYDLRTRRGHIDWD